MAKHYDLDIARWEGEGGAPTPELRSATQARGARDRKTLASWQIACGVALLMGSAWYARRKRWI